MRTLPMLLAGAALALFTSACSHTFGPVVTDVRSAGDGRIVVRRCSVEIAAHADDVEMKDCVEKTVDVGPPLALPRS
jgi:hypothetical protein